MEEDLKHAEAKSVQAKSRIIRETFGLGPQYRRSWLQIDAPEKEVVIAPQLGDDVVFFPNAYIEFLRDRDYLEEIVPYYCFDGVLSRCFAVKCRVVDVRYLFPDSDDFDIDRLVMSDLTLAVLAVPKDAMGAASRQRKRRHGESDGPTHMYDLVEPTFGQFVGVNASLSRLSSDATPAQRHNIRVLCHTSHVEDFLVLDAKFEMSIRAGWSVGDRIETSMISLDLFADPFNIKRYTGTIESMEPVSVDMDYGTAAIVTPHSSVRVKWDGMFDPDSDQHDWQVLSEVSPWDLELLAEQQQHLKSWQEECCSATHRQAARRISEDGKQQLLVAIDRLMAESCFQYFVRLSEEIEVEEPDYDEEARYLVSLPHQSGYVSAVANPMDLTKIRARVENGYYRQREALLGDARTLCRNTKEYEASTSRHISSADMLYGAIKQVIDIAWPRTNLLTGEMNEYLVYYSNQVTGPVRAPGAGDSEIAVAVTTAAAEKSSEHGGETTQADVKPRNMRVKRE